MDIATNEMLAYYGYGNSVAKVAEKYSVSTGKMYHLLRAAGCEFRKKGHLPGWHPTKEAVERSAKKRRGRHMDDASRKKLSEAKKSTYNGLNGYGHTKDHPRGYVLAYAPLHPNAHKDGYIMLHTVVMERSIGRYLAPDETVHHKNHIRNDNRIENLELMKKHDHFSMHMKERHRKGVLPSIS